MAWLHAVIEHDDKDAPKRTRLDEIKLAIDSGCVGESADCLFTQSYVDDYTKLPKVDVEFSYLIEWIHELGFCESGGFGAITLTYQTLWAWADLMQIFPSPTDIKLLRDMSSSFIAWQEKSKKRETPDPLKDLENGNAIELSDSD